MCLYRKFRSSKRLFDQLQQTTTRFKFPVFKMYKIFVKNRRNELSSLFIKGPSIPVNQWVDEKTFRRGRSKRKYLYANNKTKYPFGFHVYATVEAAIRAKSSVGTHPHCVKEVFCTKKDILAFGSQNNDLVLVLKNMYVSAQGER